MTIITVILLLEWFGCSRSDPYFNEPDPPVADSAAELCDGLDNNLDGQVDEPFKNDNQLYVHVDHCGACSTPCSTDAVTLEVDCAEIDDSPQCVATECIAGHVISNSFACVDWSERLCMPCMGDDECGNFDGAVCTPIDGEPRCAVECFMGTCPSGYVCSQDNLCTPPSESCQCAPGDHFSMFCEIPVEEEICIGSTTCDDGILSECEGSDEICDGVDNDCNGTVDDPYVNSYGGYGVDIQNCGACGIDCTENPLPDNDLICGGPPTDPICAMLCTDTLDGIQPGDSVDADLLIETGCECVVVSLSDSPGPLLGTPEEVDTNCDGADGIVEQSYYVSPSGDDTGPGSPHTPMASINAAIEAANASLTTSSPRPHVFVSAGSYSEVLTLMEGVRVHGGYSPDFLSLDPATYLTEAHAPSWSSAPGGAGLLAQGVGISMETSVDGMYIRGAAAPTAAEPSFGAYIRNSGGFLSISMCIIEASDGVVGMDGTDGLAGSSAGGSGADGDIPRGAIESASHACMPSTANVVAGGQGQDLSCGSINVSGGDGGDSDCPGGSTTTQESGNNGQGPAGTPGGSGGDGGWDARGPMYDYEGCPDPVCCGLAHFIVTYDYHVAYDGNAGSSGQDGSSGSGCVDPLGNLNADIWTGGASWPGTDGSPGSGGGGGGAGGGALLEWNATWCEFEDGLGGGGGGGGAGGCGGNGAEPGSSGSPTIGVVVSFGGIYPLPSSAPDISGIVVRTGTGGEGGRGGTGGDGGLGAPGGVGGGLDPEDKITPTLAGPSSGGHGGHGGAGGGGGGGGGGCGGSSVGFWFDTGPAIYPGVAAGYQSLNDFDLGPGGEGGNGGGGSTMGDNGEDGEVINVVEI